MADKVQAREIALARAYNVFLWGPLLPEVGSFVREAAERHAEKLREIKQAEALLKRLRSDALRISRQTSLRIAEHYTSEEILAARQRAFP